jgi:hypothetical protein
MFFRDRLPCGKMTRIIVRKTAKDRLKTRCFRGVSSIKAGNFSVWSSPEEFFQDEIVREQFLNYLSSIWAKRELGTYRFTVCHNHAVGWEGTAPLSDYVETCLETFELNPSGKGWGLRIKLDQIHLRAPLTNKATIAFEFKLKMMSL